jgi:hypothetical protein
MKCELMFRNLYHVMADWALVIIAARTRCEGSSRATLGVLPDYGHPLRSNIPDKLSSRNHESRRGILPHQQNFDVLDDEIFLHVSI